MKRVNSPASSWLLFPALINPDLLPVQLLSLPCTNMASLGVIFSTNTTKTMDTVRRLLFWLNMFRLLYNNFVASVLVFSDFSWIKNHPFQPLTLSRNGSSRGFPAWIRPNSQFSILEGCYSPFSTSPLRDQDVSLACCTLKAQLKLFHVLYKLFEATIPTFAIFQYQLICLNYVILHIEVTQFFHLDEFLQ